MIHFMLQSSFLIFQYSLYLPPNFFFSFGDSPMGANLLFTAPPEPYTFPMDETNDNTFRDDSWHDRKDVHYPFLDADGMDLDEMDVIRPDLSPLILDHRAALPPNNSDNHEIEDSLKPGISQTRKKYTSKGETLAAVHKMLQDASHTPTTMLINLLESAAEDSHRDSAHALPGKAFSRSTNMGNICKLLDLIMANEKGAAILKEWMRPHAVDLVCSDIHREMEEAKPHLYMTAAETTPEFIESWDINDIMDPISDKITPTWTTVLEAATESKQHLAKAEDHEKFSRERRTVSSV